MSQSSFLPPDLHDRRGGRLYLNRPEQERLNKVLLTFPSRQRLFLDTLLYSGARISEALELRYSSVDLDGGVLTLRTLKQGGRRVYTSRLVPAHTHDLDLPALAQALGLDPNNASLEVVLRQSVKQPATDKWREVPVPRSYLDRLDSAFEVRRKQEELRNARTNDDNSDLLFGFRRTKASDWVKSAMHAARITGAQASAKGLRHTFGVNNALAGTPQAVLQQLMGHASPNMTARYMKVVDAELREIVRKTWQRADNQSI